MGLVPASWVASHGSRGSKVAFPSQKLSKTHQSCQKVVKKLSNDNLKMCQNRWFLCEINVACFLEAEKVGGTSQGVVGCGAPGGLGAKCGTSNLLKQALLGPVGRWCAHKCWVVSLRWPGPAPVEQAPDWRRGVALGAWGRPGGRTQGPKSGPQVDS